MTSQEQDFSDQMEVELDREETPMNASLGEYLAHLTLNIASTQQNRATNLRTTEYTVTQFELTKRDRLWAMRQDGQMLDSVLLCAENKSEQSVHLDMLLTLDPNLIPFFHRLDSDSASLTTGPDLPRYQVDSNIKVALLNELIYFSYHRRCALTEQNVSPIADIGVKYNISSLVQYCFDYLLANTAPNTAIKGLVLASEHKFATAEAQYFFQQYVAENFEQIWQTNQADLLSLGHSLLSTILSWDKLDLKSESTVWRVIQAWIAHDLKTRHTHLASLMQNTLRIGRLSEQFISECILNSTVFRAQPIETQCGLVHLIDQVMHGEMRKQAITDGHGLLFAKSCSEVQYQVHFQSRHNKHLLIAAAGWIEGRPTNSVEIYDQQLNVWRSNPTKLHSVVAYFGFEIIDSTLYVFGGCNGREIFKTLNALDLSKNDPKWIAKCSMLERRCYVSSAVVNGRIYAIGGFNQQDRIRKCELFDPTSNTWTEIAHLNYARSDASATAFNGRVYVAGGINDTNIEASVEVYHVQSNHWQLVQHMTSPRSSFSLVCYQNRIWAIGGNDGTNRLSLVESYDPEANTWRSEASLYDARSTFKAINFNGQLMAVGGFNGENPIGSVEKYDGEQSVWRKVCSLMHNRSGLALISVPNQFYSVHI